MRLVFATNNTHKLQEVRQILPANYEVLSLEDVGLKIEIDETGETLEENSRIKAQTVWDWLGEKGKRAEVDGVIADDTGLEIHALNGEPGVRTARWAGDPPCNSSNRKKALLSLEGNTDREARFRTVITFITSQRIEQVEGIVTGTIAKEERGNGGFGYDPIFIPDGENDTFAELPKEKKNAISHRARAIQALRTII